ncbi:MAG: hypothetical protein IIB83_06030 [Bacteroidetes bacterium]|nr:hypothetical protein [Bacteroidota bacterium]
MGVRSVYTRISIWFASTIHDINKRARKKNASGVITKKIIKELFIELPWRTEKLFRQTLKVINDLNLQVSILPELSDIDTESDLNNWINKETKLSTCEFKSFVKTELFYN